VKAYHNPSPLEDLSEQHERYKAWPNQGRPQKFKTVEAKVNTSTLDGVSETKTEFVERQLPKKPPVSRSIYFISQHSIIQFTAARKQIYSQSSLVRR
jgi:hypothetical protein